MLSQAMSGDPKNTDLKDTWVALQIELARVESKVGGNGDAHDRLARALPTAEELHHIEPTNKRWTSQVEFIEKEMRALENRKRTERRAKWIKNEVGCDIRKFRPAHQKAKARSRRHRPALGRARRGLGGS